MKIVFNGIGCGFGNNGGTQTNFRTANQFAELGHEVEIWSHGRNEFTWFGLNNNIKYLVNPVRTCHSILRPVNDSSKHTHPP